MQEDTRWKQRFANYKKAVFQLNQAVALNQQRPLSDLEKQGLIQAFEYCHELAWNVMKDFFDYQGKTALMGSRDVTRVAFKRGLISDGEGWMSMISSRNQTSHTYNETTANEVVGKIIAHYHRLFLALQSTMQGRYDED